MEYRVSFFLLFLLLAGKGPIWASAHLERDVTAAISPSTRAAPLLSERSAVDSQSRAAQHTDAILFHVTTATLPITSTSISEHYVTLPDDFPHIEVITKSVGIEAGYLFLDSFSPGTEPRVSYALIVDDYGDPVYYMRAPDNMRLTDFKPHANGLLSYLNTITDQVLILDSTYTPVRTIQVNNLDPHETLILPNGHVLLLTVDKRTVDMSQIAPGGKPAATVVGEIIRELDPSDNVVFEWNMWDHFAITDTLRDLTLDEISYTHGNSLDIDKDGNIILSCRGLDEITKIDRAGGTGNILWRLGGKNNQFTLIGDTEFFFAQHDARIFADGHLTLFDDQHDPFRVQNPMKPSRALEYILDEVNKEATLVRSYTDGVFSSATGNFQKLANGNWLIGWGGSTYLATEVDPSDKVLLRLKYADNPLNGEPVVWAYRVVRHPWSGCPAQPPVLVAQAEGAKVALHFSWNGATSVTDYQILGGATQDPTTVIATKPRTRFEDTVEVTAVATGDYYFRVLPVTSDHCQPVYSNVVSASLVVADRSVFLPVILNK